MRWSLEVCLQPFRSVNLFHCLEQNGEDLDITVWDLNGTRQTEQWMKQDLNGMRLEKNLSTELRKYLPNGTRLKQNETKGMLNAMRL
jgi:hypothetical protein